MAFNWQALVGDLLNNAPSVIQTIETDKANASTETKTQLATQALVQASTVAQQVDPSDSATINGINAVASGIITAFKAPSPVPAAQAASSSSRRAPDSTIRAAQRLAIKRWRGTEVSLPTSRSRSRTSAVSHTELLRFRTMRSCSAPTTSVSLRSSNHSPSSSSANVW